MRERMERGRGERGERKQRHGEGEEREGEVKAGMRSYRTCVYVQTCTPTEDREN